MSLFTRFIESLEKHQKNSANKIGKLLRQKLMKSANSIRNDIPIRKEAVFLPYKGEHVGQLGKVYGRRRTKIQPAMPMLFLIPYYDKKNPDGSFRKRHYEGRQYPDYVPIVRYQEFDFEKHQPDMIYIHNPYDELNFVTSVDPFFFSKI